MQRQIGWPAAAVLLGFIAAWIVCLALHVPVPPWMGALGSVVGAVILAFLRPLLGGGPPSTPPNAVEREAAKLGQRGFSGVGLLALISFVGLLALTALLAIVCSGCVAAVAKPGADPAAVTQCQQIAQWRNGIVVGDTVVGGTGAALGTIAALEPAGTGKDVLAASAAGAAGLVAIGAAVAGFEESAFQSDKCSDYVSDLPPPPLPLVQQVDGGAASDAGGQ